MRTSLVMLAASGVALAAIVTPAGAASAETAIDTIGRLEAEGYYVNIDRVGSAPLGECIVTSVRNPQTQTQLVRVERFGKHGKKDIDYIPVVTRRSITVSLNCSR